MRALQLITPGEPIELREVEEAPLGPREVRVAVHAAGICHSDAHYRAGRSPAHPLPLTLGHEVAGIIIETGAHVTRVRAGDRVCLHYLIACGDCLHCSRGSEQFCATGSMLGHYRAGGWAESIVVPERNCVPLPDAISFAHGAVLMCSSATALHALRRGRLSGGETVAVIGVGGLGMSAVQLARALGARAVYAIDRSAEKLALAAWYGAIPIDASSSDAVVAVRDATDGVGVDVALEVVGAPATMQQAVSMTAVHGRAVIAGLSTAPLVVDSYRELIGREIEIIGANDHLLQELPLLIELARSGRLHLAKVVQRTVPLDAAIVNAVLDDLDAGRAPVRTVIVPV
jgi:2-desacetyl-2-hydroxyethyl bacteriochlorophyllide A dehydrogenase